MAENEKKLQLVTFQLSNEKYGIDIMDVNQIVKSEEIRYVPAAPHYVAGILNLRGEIIPIINLHKRFQLEKLQLNEEDELLGGYMILNINKTKLGIVIDKIYRVITVDFHTIQAPPQMMSGIGIEYIQGVVNNDGDLLIILNVKKLFNSSELLQIKSLGAVQK